MTLPASGAISLSQVNTEIGQPATQQITLNDALVRSLAGVLSGAISLSNLHGQSFRAKAIFAGGALNFEGSSTVVGEIDGLRFSDGAALNLAAALSAVRSGLAGVASLQTGYFAGGTDYYTNSAEIDGVRFTSEAAVNPAATLAVARRGVAGVSNSSGGKGYFGGGETKDLTPQYNEIDGLRFSDEAAINPAATLALARAFAAGVMSSEKGYFGGGVYVAGLTYSTAEIDGLRFSDEAAINPAAALSVAREGAAGVSGSTKAYFGGGGSLGVGAFADIDGIRFSDETGVNPAVTVGGGRGGLAGASSLTHGYFAGGDDSAGYSGNGITGMRFSDEAFITVAATLATARGGLAGVA